ncbi:MAG: methyltransferase domain-containing protein [Candidatus Omnitrophica bacterium]|nr:methyltransferase domain-containing protein [Candidatus Omnitrophota bacterium]
MHKDITKFLSNMPKEYKKAFKYLYNKITHKNYGTYIAYEKMPSKNEFKDLYNRKVVLRYGKNTFIDPEVIIDSPESIRIGANCIIRKGVVLRPEGGEIVIGDNCVINHYCVFHGKGGIYIGDWVIIGPHCGFYAQNHAYESFSLPITKQENTGKGIILMGDNWVGGHSVICDDVTMGKGAVVGANSTVTKSVPMASIAVGSPAKVIKKRYLGQWDFQKAERAASEGMTMEIQQHVIKRGQLLRDLINPEDYILDAGCGEGIITSIIAEKNPHVIGCDYSIEAVNIAKNQYPCIEFIYSNSTNLRFNSGTFTKVILSDVAEHLLPRQFIKTLKEMRRVLKKDGMLILSTPLTGNKKNTSTYAHIYEYSKDEMESILMKIFSKVKLIDNDFGIFIAQNDA